MRAWLSHDLPAVDAVYHQSCSVTFRTKKQIPKSYAAVQTCSKKGRPQDHNKLTENDDEQNTVSDLVTKMQEFLGDNSGIEAYSVKHMKGKLEQHFGLDQVIITELNGRPNVVSLRTTAAAIFISSTRNGCLALTKSQKNAYN